MPIRGLNNFQSRCMFSNLLYVFRFAPAAVRKGILLEVLHGLLIAAPTGILFFVIQQLFTAHPDSQKIWTSIIVMIVLMCFQFPLALKAMLASNDMVYAISKEMRIRLGDHLQKLSFGYYKQRDPGDLASVVLQDVANFEMILSHTIANISSAIVGTGLIFIFLLLNNWQLALILISAVVLVFPLMLGASYIIQKAGIKQIASRNATGARFLEYIQGIRYIKAFGMTGPRFKTLDNALLSLKKESIRMEALPGPLAMLSSIFFELFYLLMIWAGVSMFTDHVLTIPVLIAFVIIGYRLYEPLKVILTDYAILRYMNVSLERIIAVFRVPQPEVLSPETPRAFDITFEGVTFGYTAERQVLSGISFHAKERTMTALVGASGSGKSTITALIARFWDVGSGVVKIGGVDVRSIPSAELYASISEVFQDVYLFDDSIYNNIKIGKPSAGEAEIVAAARKAQVMEFAGQLENGLHAIVGEGGNKLSGGQKQRISIARALLKDAPIVLLDEATASLDPENEIYIQEAIQELVKNKTVIVIAHKLATVRGASQILVLDKGIIAERGAHEELMMLHGLYRRLWDIQQRASGWKFKTQTFVF